MTPFFASLPHVPLRCIPPDFVNPFLPYRLPATVYALLLVALFLGFGKFSTTGGHRQGGRWLRPLWIPTAVVVAVAGWVWLQGLLWLPACAIAPFGTDWRFGLQDADQRLLPWAVWFSGTLTILTLVVAALWILPRRNRQVAR